jgi:ABC-2 type transport system ATP-binding protein
VNTLEVSNITKRYTEHVALNNVSLAVPEKSIFGLLGPNGAGKTTLIRIINQIINADEGQIMLNGSALNPSHTSLIGYLPEERGLYKKMKVGDQLIYLSQLKGMTKKVATEKSKSWLKKFEALEWWNKKIEDLSKGMAQKIQFISTVMHEPKLIILDEPFSGFDPVNAKVITDEIFELREKGSTIIFSTHRMETVEELCDHIALINKSKKILEGPKKQVKETYRSNTFIVHHVGNLRLENDNYTTLKSEQVDDNFFHTTIQSNHKESPNKLLSSLIEVTEVHSFIEKIPTMSEIFINLVKEGEHE